MLPLFRLPPASRRTSPAAGFWPWGLGASAAYGLLVFFTLPAGVAVLNDDFGYLRSVVETLQRGRPWTDGWLEPWAASLSLLAAGVFKATGSFLLATQGVQAVAAAIAAAGAMALLRGRGWSARASAAGGLLLVSMPTLLWKQLEFTGMVLVLPGLLWAIWAAERRRWGWFFVAWAIAVSSRQSAAAWLVLPACVAWQERRNGAPWRGAACVVAGGAAWVVGLKTMMNVTAAQAAVTGRWLERLASATALEVVVLGVAIGFGAAGIGRWVAVLGAGGRMRAEVPVGRALAVVAAVAALFVAVAEGRIRLFFEHASFGMTAGLVYAVGAGALGIAGWLVAGGRIRGERLIAAGASLALVATRREVWDYYYVDVALLALFAMEGGAEVRKSEAGGRRPMTAGWLRWVLAGGAALQAVAWWG